MAAVLLAMCAAAPAAERVVPQYRIVPRAFTSDDGLPQSGVNEIVQGRDGYLWLGTFGGLVRFDGSSFRVFRERFAPTAAAAEERRAGPSSDRVVSLLEDDRGRLWIGTQDAGLNVFEHGVFRHLPVCGGACQVSDIEQGRDGALWMTTDVGAFRLQPDSARAARLASPVRTGIDYLAVDGRGRVFAGGYAGLFVVSGDRLRRIALPDDDGTHITLLERDGEGLLVGTGRRLYRYRHDGAHWMPQPVAQPTHAAEDALGRWWVAQAAGGVLREVAPGDWRDVPAMSGVGVASMAKDDEGNLWVGTASRGLWRLREPVFGLLTVAQLGPGASGRAIVPDGRGGFWLGVACGPLRHLDAEGRLRSWPLAKALRNDCVSSLLQDRSGVLWIGTNAGTLGRLAGDTVERVASWRDGESLGLWQREDGRLLVNAGASSYALRLGEDGRPVERRRLWALEGMRISSAIPALRGGMWFAGDLGVVRLAGEQAVERWTPREGLSSRFARALYEDGEGALWVGTYGAGLNRIAGGKVQRYGRDNGLSDEAVSCILADRRGRLWLGGNRGVTLLPAPREAGTSIASLVFAGTAGLWPPEINGGTSSPCVRDAHGRLWFSLVEGFAVLDPERISAERPMVPRAHVEDVAVAGVAREAPDGVLRLESFTRNLQIRYTAVNLSSPGETRFRFRLSGFDADWVEAGQDRGILYPSVPWGEHLFEVQARVGGGPWSPAASLRIVHPQPWYQRPWIWTLASSMGLVVLLGATRQDRARTPPPVSRRPARRERRERDPPRS